MIKIVIVDEGLSKLANEFGSLITQGQWGTGTAIPNPTDTGLGSAIPTTLATVSAASSGAAAQFTHTVLSGIGTGQTLTEYELRYANGDSLNRTVVGGINKTQNFEVETITIVNFVRS